MLDRRESRSTTNRPGQIHGLARPEERVRHLASGLLCPTQLLSLTQEYNTRSRLLRVRIVRAKGLMKKVLLRKNVPLHRK